MNDKFMKDDNRQFYSWEHGKELSQFLKTKTLSIEENYNNNLLILNELNQELTEKESELKHLEEEMKDTAVLFSANNKLQISIKSIKDNIEQIRTNIEQISASNDIKADEINKFKESYQYFDLLLKETEKVCSSQSNRKETFMGLKLLETQENERQRIARDLHDSTVQNLTSIIHKNELCIKLLDIDIIRARLELTTMSQTIKSIINEMREIIYDLKPMSLSDLGLVVTVRHVAKQIMVNHNIKATVDCNDEQSDILPVIKLTLFRVIQEACNNIVKHAKATTLDININFGDLDIEVVIKDNGIGFDTNIFKGKNDSISGFGIPIMKERIYLLCGSIDIFSKKNEGTIIKIKVPIKTCGGKNTNE